LQIGIDLKGKLINSEYIKDLSKIVTGNGIATEAIEINKKFIEEIIELLKPYLNKKEGLSTNDLMAMFESFPQSSQKFLSGRFTEVPISNIENNIEKTLVKREEKPGAAVHYGEELYKSTKIDLALLKKMLGANNVQFQMLANKLANEIMQCSITYYNYYREEDVLLLELFIL